jgi:hypothetical protein
LIKVPKNALGEALYTTAEEREALSQSIRSDLAQIVRDIAADPVQIAVKGTAALERIRKEHDTPPPMRRAASGLWSCKTKGVIPLITLNTF